MHLHAENNCGINKLMVVKSRVQEGFTQDRYLYTKGMRFFTAQNIEFP